MFFWLVGRERITGREAVDTGTGIRENIGKIQSRNTSIFLLEVFFLCKYETEILGLNIRL